MTDINKAIKKNQDEKKLPSNEKKPDYLQYGLDDWADAPLLVEKTIEVFKHHAKDFKHVHPITKKHKIMLTKDMVDAMQPKTALETMLAGQMANLHLMQGRLILDTHQYGCIYINDTSSSHETLQRKAKIVQKNVCAMTKISNACTQMAIIFDKLQTKRQQPPMNIGNINVESGGQAVVTGSVNIASSEKNDGDTP